MAETTRVTGLTGLRRALEGLGDEMARSIALQGLKAGAEPMRRAIVRQVQRRTKGRGQAARRIVIDDDFRRFRKGGRRSSRASTLARLGGGSDQPAVAIGPDKRAFYLMFVELGWQPKGGKRVRGRRMLRAGFDRSRKQTLRVARRRIKQGIVAYARRVGP